MGDTLGKKLHKATQKGKSQLAMELIERGANVNIRDGYNNKPLHDAAKKGNGELVSRLIEKGANIKAQGYFCNTALHFAALKGHKKVVSILLEAGAETEIKEIRMGFTPLHGNSGLISVVDRILHLRGEASRSASSHPSSVRQANPLLKRVLSCPKILSTTEIKPVLRRPLPLLMEHTRQKPMVRLAFVVERPTTIAQLSKMIKSFIFQAVQYLKCL